MSTFLADLRYAWRTLRASPAFTVVAVGSLALGIGVNTAAFSIVSAMLIRPLPVEGPDRLVAVFGQREGTPSGAVSYPTLRDLRALDDVFSGVAGHSGSQFAIRTDGRPEMVWGEIVTSDYFATAGVRPVLGRGFVDPARGDAAEAAAVVLSHALWERRFGSDPGVLGRTLRINGEPYEIVGVAPEGFSGTRLFSFVPELFLPLEPLAQSDSGLAATLDDRRAEWLLTVARLQPGVTPEAARQAVAGLARALARDHPDTHEGLQLRVFENRSPINPWILPPNRLRQMLALITLAMALVLLLACANVANLLLARAAGRAREIAIRLSIGSSRARLVRQLLTESLLLALLGGGVGLLLGTWLVEASAGLRPTLDFETNFQLRVDGQVLALTAASALLSVLLFGLLPALHASGPSLVGSLKEARGSSGRGSRLSELLVAGQVALSLVLLVGAGLFLRSFRAAQDVDVGFDTRSALVGGIDLAPLDYEEDARREFHARLRTSLSRLPGVRSAALASALPLDAYASSAIVEVPGRALRPGEPQPEIFYSVVSPGYFETLRTPVVRGRAIDERDGAEAAAVAVVNETMTERMWPGEEPIGKRFTLRGDATPLTVVGVARDGKYLTIGEDARPYFFQPLAQRPVSRFRLVVRTDGEPLGVAPAIRAALRDLDPELPIFGLKTLEQQMETPLSGPESGAATVGLFGVLALLLAASGIYGVVSYAVARRTREIGIRMALGARREQVLRLVLARGARLAATGMAVGLAGSLLIARGLTGLLFGVSGTDPMTYAAISLLLVTVAMLATWVPARRAARVDPLVALRHE